MAISCVVEYPEDYRHECFYGITPKRDDSMGYQGRSPWLVCQQTDLIKPDLIRLLFVVALHLDSDVDLFLVPVRLRSVQGGSRCWRESDCRAPRWASRRRAGDPKYPTL